jgi:mannose-6-phosphate isomerase-like protein (cupin superfamily)
MTNIEIKKIDEIAPYNGPHEIAGIRFRAVREGLGVSAWGMNVLDIEAHCDGYPEHDHERDGQEEVYVVLRGSVVLRADGNELSLVEGDAVRVAPHVRRQFFTRNDAVRLLALGGTPGKPYVPSMGG